MNQSRSTQLQHLLQNQGTTRSARRCAALIASEGYSYFSTSSLVSIKHLHEPFDRLAASNQADEQQIDGFEILLPALASRPDEAVSIYWIVSDPEWFVVFTDAPTERLLGVLSGASSRVYQQYHEYEAMYLLGEQLHSELMDAFGLESEAWAKERIARVEARLQFARFPAPRLRAEIVWIEAPTAFTVPGRYVYITRELLQRLATDDAAAFVIAHEMAHHDLGHLDLFSGYLAPLKHVPGGILIGVLRHTIDRQWFSPERETDADLRALELCLRAGYDGLKCLNAFDILEHFAVDYSDIDIAYGPVSELEPAGQGVHRALAQFQLWKWQRRRGYLPIRDRKEMLLSRLDERKG